MRTPKEYTDNIKKGIITRDMLSNCLYSVNKRAKNYRDNERKSRRYGNWTYADSAAKRKEAFYNQKDIMLSILTPNCIHTVTRVHTKRETAFNKVEGELEYIYHTETIKEYYLFYDMGFCSFHHPIKEEEVENYKNKYNLNVSEISDLITHGAECKDLIPPQCVKKVIALIQSAEYRYIS